MYLLKVHVLLKTVQFVASRVALDGKVHVFKCCRNRYGKARCPARDVTPWVLSHARKSESILKIEGVHEMSDCLLLGISTVATPSATSTPTYSYRSSMNTNMQWASLSCYGSKPLSFATCAAAYAKALVLKHKFFVRFEEPILAFLRSHELVYCSPEFWRSSN